MARQTYYVTREQKHPLYKTRMLQAGPLELDASAARLYRKLGVELSDEAPRRAAPRPAQSEAEKTGAMQVEAPKPTVRKPVRNRKTGRKVKT